MTLNYKFIKYSMLCYDGSGQWSTLLTAVWIAKFEYPYEISRTRRTSRRGEAMNRFGHRCRMNDNRFIKTTVFGMMNGTSKGGRPAREWLDDVRDWCNQDIHTLSQMAQDQTKWRYTVNHACDTNTGIKAMEQKKKKAH